MNPVSVEAAGALLLIASLVALVAKRLKLPYTVGLVIVGFVLAASGVAEGIQLTKELVFRALLPPLIFEAAFFLPFAEIRRNLKPILVLASVGVLLSAFVIGAVMSVAAGWPFAVALVFGALIAATDPVAVIAMFKEQGIHGRLRILVEAESLVNDGVAAVLFSVATLVAMGTQLSVGDAFAILCREAFGGVLAGASVSLFGLFLAGRTDDHLVELSFTAIIAYGSFLLADHFHASGVLAVLTAGLIVGNTGHIGAITDHGRQTVSAFWEFGAFLSNSVIFLLIGTHEFSLIYSLIAEWKTVFLAVTVSLAARAMSSYGLSAVFRNSNDRIERSHQHVLFWGGLKGALSLALVLGLPETFPYKRQLIAAAFGVVAFSIVVQGVTMPKLLRQTSSKPDSQE